MRQKEEKINTEPWKRTVPKYGIALKITCVVLAAIVLFSVSVCLYYIKVNGALAQENIGLSGANYELKREIERLKSEIETLKIPEEQSTGQDIYSYEKWEQLHNAGVITASYQEYVDALDGREKFSIDEYFKAKEEWKAASDAGLTELSFEEWRDAIKKAESKASGSFYEDYKERGGGQ